MVFDRKEYEIKNKKKIKQQRNEWYQKNKETEKNKHKKWYEDNKEYYKKYRKEYRQTPEGKKSDTISNWKIYGLKLFGYTYDEVYEYYLDCDNCEVCNKDISMGGHQKNMDHCHDTGIFRWILCSSCNTYDNWMNKI
tara:strand:- start:29 stop:439 length:411 start_codon:yes stop_codon:yes gene_type:complete